jgi:hypothetical protein
LQTTAQPLAQLADDGVARDLRPAGLRLLLIRQAGGDPLEVLGVREHFLPGLGSARREEAMAAVGTFQALAGL